MLSRHLRLAVAMALAVTVAVITQAIPASAALPSPFDNSFGTDGIAVNEIPLQKSQSSASDLVSDISGNLYVLLHASAGTGSEIVTVAKYSSSGAVVGSFGTNGQSQEIKISGASIALQADGKIVVSGFQYSDGQTKIAVYRFNTNGSIDTTFATDGAYIIPSFPGKNIWSSTLLLAINQSSDRIHIAFNVNNIQDNDQNFYFITLDDSGRLDINWSNGGAEEVVPRTGSVSAYSTLTNIQLLSDGSLLGIGSAMSSNGVRAIVLTKLTQSGYLDLTFDGASNGNGVVFIQFASESDAFMTAAVVLQDDSIVLAGNAGTYFYGPWYYGVAKVLSDGTVDTSFGTNGFKLSNLQVNYNTAPPRRIGIQTDGRYVFPINSGTTGGFMRVEANGTFSNSPNCSQCLWSGANDGATSLSLLVQSDSKIVVTGNLRNENNAIIRRFTSTGTADGTFENRVLEIVKEKWTSFLGSIKPLAGGAVLGIGEAAVNRGISVERGLILKFTPNGTLDGQFGRGGYQFLAPPTDDYSVNVHDSYVQPDGKIVVLATGRESGDTALMLWRVTSTGALDNTFGTNGFTSVAEANTDLYPSSLVAGTDGKLMVPLQKFVNSGGNTWIYQFTSNGTLDSSFTDGQNVPGAKQPSIGDGSGNTFPAYSFPADNGKFFVSGSTSINSSSHAYLAKFLPTGILDTSFSGGYVTWDSQQTNQMNYISHVARDNSGKVYVFGSTTNPSEKPLLVQLNADGSRNNSFNGTGFAALDFRDPTQIDYSYVVDVVLNDDVFTVIGSGDSDRAPYSSRSFSGVGRISTSGVLDANFGTNGFIDPFPTSESYFSDIALLSNGVSLIAGMVTVGKESKMALMRIGPTGSAPTTAPPTTAPPTTAPPTTAPPTTTTVPTVITETSDEIKLVISVSQAAVLKRMKLTVPSGSKVTMRSTSAKVCRVVKTRVIASATGTCRISVTITDKKKKKTTKSTSFRVS